jgi:hypothetical protein
MSLMSAIASEAGCPAGPVTLGTEGSDALPRLRPFGLDLAGRFGGLGGQTGRFEILRIFSEIRPVSKPFGATVAGVSIGPCGRVKGDFSGSGP